MLYSKWDVIINEKNQIILKIFSTTGQIYIIFHSISIRMKNIFLDRSTYYLLYKNYKVRFSHRFTFQGLSKVENTIEIWTKTRIAIVLPDKFEMGRNEKCWVSDQGPWVEADGAVREYCILEKGFDFGEIPGFVFALRED